MPAKLLDGCQTDPEPGMDSRRTTVRNMRSKCRCSCVLQFTFRRAVSCVLHRPPSQVIHCIVLYLKACLPGESASPKKHHEITHPIAGSTKVTRERGGRSLSGRPPTGCYRSTAPQSRAGPPNGRGTLTAPQTRRAVASQEQAGSRREAAPAPRGAGRPSPNPTSPFARTSSELR